MQYTLRNIPPSVNALLRQRARDEGKSLNEVAIEAIVRGLGLSDAPTKQRDLSDLAGGWQSDKATDEALADQRRIDPDLWR